MEKIGPYIDFPVPAGSIIICWKCGDWLYITINEILAMQGLSEDRLIDIRSGGIVKGKHHGTLKCNFCEKNIYRSQGEDLGLVCYISQPETLGERIHHFMVQGANP